MTTSEKLIKIAENVQKNFEFGKSQGGGGDPTEAFLDIYLENGNRQNISYAFSGDCWTEGMLSKIKYVVKPIETKTTNRYAQGVFFRLNRSGTEKIDMTEVCKWFDFSECFMLDSLFHNAKVKNVTINASKAQSLKYAFASGDNGEIDNVTLTVSEACTEYYQVFYYQKLMTEVRFTDGSVIAANIDFQRSVLLSAESYHSIISHCSKTASFTLTLPPEATVRSVFDAKFGSGAWDAITAQYPNLTIMYS